MQARRLLARQGIVWVVAGYRLFRANPPLLTMLTFLYLMVFTVMLVLPAGIGLPGTGSSCVPSAAQ